MWAAVFTRDIPAYLSTEAMLLAALLGAFDEVTSSKDTIAWHHTVMVIMTSGLKES